MRIERTVYVEPPTMVIYDEVIVVGMPEGIVSVHDVDVGEVTEVGGGAVVLVEIDDVDVDVFTKVVVVCVLERVVVGMMGVTMGERSDKEVGSASLVGSVGAVPIALVESVAMGESVADSCTDGQSLIASRPCHLPSTCQSVRCRTRSQSLLVAADGKNG